MALAQLQTTINQVLLKKAVGAIKKTIPLNGGSTCTSYKIITEKEVSLFLKTLPTPPKNMFKTEARSLESLRISESLRIPKVIHVEDQFLLLEDLQSLPPNSDYWKKLGQGLAELHQRKVEHFGFDCDNYCGSTLQANPVTSDGYRFFADNRLRYQCRLAASAGLIDSELNKQLEKICLRLPELIPPQTPSLIHGDLWSGNVIADNKGDPALIDPAAYWGWAEADIAMTKLFGGFPSSFYQSYLYHHPLLPGWQ